MIQLAVSAVLFGGTPQGPTQNRQNNPMQSTMGRGSQGQRIQDTLATHNNAGVENNVSRGGVVWVFAVKK